MRFLIDAQLPPALARWLVAEGHEADMSAIVTKDEDFAQRKAMSRGGPTIVWIRSPNTRRATLLAWFATALPDILVALQRGETLIEVVQTRGG